MAKKLSLGIPFTSSCSVSMQARHCLSATPLLYGPSPRSPANWAHTGPAGLGGLARLNGLAQPASLARLAGQPRQPGKKTLTCAFPRKRSQNLTRGDVKKKSSQNRASPCTHPHHGLAAYKGRSLLGRKDDAIMARDQYPSHPTSWVSST